MIAHSVPDTGIEVKSTNTTTLTRRFQLTIRVYLSVGARTARVDLGSIRVRLSATEARCRSVTELNVIAPLAIIGLSNTPNHGYRIPAAIGTPATL